MVELSPANLVPGLELPLSKPSVDFPEAPGSSVRPAGAGGTLGAGGRGVTRLSVSSSPAFLAVFPRHCSTEPLQVFS